MNSSLKKSKADCLLMHLRYALNLHQIMQEDLDVAMSTASKLLAEDIGTSTSVAHKLLELVLDKEIELNKHRVRPISSSEIEQLIEEHLNKDLQRR